MAQARRQISGGNPTHIVQRVVNDDDTLNSTIHKLGESSAKCTTNAQMNQGSDQLRGILAKVYAKSSQSKPSCIEKPAEWTEVKGNIPLDGGFWRSSQPVAKCSRVEGKQKMPDGPG